MAAQFERERDKIYFFFFHTQKQQGHHFSPPPPPPPQQKKLTPLLLFFSKFRIWILSLLLRIREKTIKSWARTKKKLDSRIVFSTSKPNFVPFQLPSLPSSPDLFPSPTFTPFHFLLPLLWTLRKREVKRKSKEIKK